MFKEFFKKYSRSQTVEKDKEVLGQLVNEGNEYLDKLKNIDQEILCIQHSTKTTFSFFSPIHNYCRTKYTWYYNWHIKPYANKIHVGVLTLFILVGIAIGSFSIVGSPAVTHAATTDCTWNNGNATGIWNDAANWSCGEVPDNTKDVIFNGAVSNADITIDVVATAGSFTVNDATGGGFGVAGQATAVNTNNHLNFSTNGANVAVSGAGVFSGYGWSEDLGWIAFGTADNADGPVSENTSTGAVTGKAKILNDGSLIDFNASPYNSNVVVNTGTGAFSGYAWSTSLGWINFTGVSLSSPAYTGTITANQNLTLDTSSGGTGSYYLGAGTFNSNGHNLTVSGNFRIVSGGTFTKGGTLTFDGTTTYTDATATPQNIGTVVINGTSATLASSMTVDSMTVTAGTLNLASAGYTLKLSGTGTPLSVAGTLNPGTNSIVQYVGTTTATNVATVPYHDLKFTPTGATAYNMGGSLTGANAMTGDLTIDANATLNTYVGVTSYDISCVNVTVNTSGVLYAGTAGSAGTSYFTISSGWTNTGTFTTGMSTVDMIGDGTLNADFKNFYILKAAATGKTTTIQASKTPSVTYQLVLGTGILTGGSEIRVASGSYVASTALSNAGATVNSTISIYDKNGASGESIYIDGGIYSVVNLRGFNPIFKINGDITVTTLTLGGGGTNANKTLDLNGHNLNATTINVGLTDSSSSNLITGNSTVTTTDLNITAHTTNFLNQLTATGTPTINVAGNWTNADTFTAGTSTVNFTKSSGTQTLNSGGVAAANTFNNVTHSGAGTLQLLTNNINIDGNFLNSGGTFTTLDGATSRNVTVDGNFTINNSSTVTANASTFTVGGNWGSTAGTFTYGTSTVNLTGTGSVTGTTFYNLTAAANTKTTTLGGATSITNVLNLGSGILNGGQVLTLGGNGTPFVTAGATITATPFAYIGNTGTTNITSATYGTLYLKGNVANLAGNITVVTLAIWYNGSGFTTVNSNGHNINAAGLIVGNTGNQGASLNMGSDILTVSGDVTINASGTGGTNSIGFTSGTMNIGGNFLNSATFNAGSSTVNFTKATGTQTLNSGGVAAANTFNNVTHSGAGTLQLLTNNINIDGDFTNSAGTFDTNSLDMTVAKNWSNSATFTAGSRTVTFDSTNATAFTGSTTFNNLVMNTTIDGAKTITFPTGSGNKQIVAGTWTLDGDVGKVLTLASVTPATAWYFQVPAAFTAGDYINVTDSYSANSYKITPGANTTNGGNNDGWIFNQAPNAPTLLGPSGYVDGAWQTDNTPTLTFNLTDPDGADQVKYEIIISTNADFSVPTIDYTSDLGAQGARNYTASPALADGIYYWEVKTIDASNVSSSYSIAGVAGTADIKVDTTVPTTDIYLNPTDPNGTNSYYKTTAPTVTFTSDDGTGSGASTVYYRWGATGDFSAYSTGIQAPEGTNTIYYYGTDIVGNSGSSSPFSRTIKVDTVTPSVTATADPVGPNGSNNYYTGTAPTITLSSTDATSGLLNIQYKWDSGSYATYTIPLTAAEGTHTLSYYATDNAGNTGSGSAGSTVYNVDTGIPTVSVVADPLAPNGTGGYYITTAPTVTLSALDTGGSGVASIQYKWDSGSYATYSTPLTASEGTHTLSYYSIDTANNNSEEGSEIFKTDLTNPIVDIYANPTDPDGGSGYYKTVPAITFTGLDNSGGSGLLNIYYHWDSNTDSTYTTGFNAPEGHHIIHYYAKDNAGNQTADITRDYYVDTSTPDDFTPSVSLASWTNNNAIAVSFSTTDSTTSIASYSIKVDSGGYTDGISSPYSLNVSAISDGTHTITVKAIDTAGNEKTVGATIYLDKTAPVAFTPVATPSTWTNGNISLAFSTTDASSGIDHYQIKIDSGEYATQTNPYTIVTTGFSDGTHTATVKATDNAGNERVADAISFQIDKTAPVAFTPVATPSTWTNSNISLAFSTSDASSGVDHYQVKIDSGDYSTQTSPYNIDTTGFSDGDHTATVKAIDTAGNERVASAVSFETDKTAPVAFTPTITTSMTNVSGTNWTNATSLNLGNISTSDATSGIASYSIQIDGSTVASNVSNPTLSGLDISSISNSIHTLTATALDNASNSRVSSSVTFGVDRATPTTDIYLNPTDPTGTNSYYKTTAPTITFTSDDGTGSGASTIYYKWDSGSYQAYTIGIQAPEGTHTIYYYGTDLAGNSGSSSPFSRTIKVDTVTPSVTATADPVGPNGSNDYFTGTAPTITLSSTDATSGLLNIQYKWDNDQFSVVSSQLSAPEGTHTLYYYATDNAGNSGVGAPSTTEYKVDTANPSAITPSSTTTPTSDTTPTWSWSASTDATSGIAGYYVKIGTTDGGSNILTETYLVGSDTLSYTPGALSDGTYYLSVKSIDVAGNVGSYTSSTAILIDTTVPTADSISINSGASYTISSTVNIAIAGASDTGSGLYQMSFSNNNSDWSDFEIYNATKTGWLLASGADGSRSVYLKLKDNAGNTTTVQISDSITLDTVNPTGTIIINSGEPYTKLTSVALTISATDANGIYQMKISNNADLAGSEWEAYVASKTWTIAAPDGTKSVYIQYKDNAGNTSSIVSDTILLDTAVPTTDIYLDPADPNGTNDYYKTTAPAVTFTSDDGAGSGASTVYYRWGAVGDFSAYSTALTPAEGTNTIYYYGTDLVGNSGVASPFSREIKTDTITPSVTVTASPVGPNGSNNYYTGTAPTITLSSSDATSGLLNIQYKWDSGSYATYTTPLTAPEGTHTLSYYATDNAGNTGSSSPGSTVYNVDTGIPTVSVEVAPLSPNGDNGYYITTAPTVTLSALDTGGSGVASIQYKWDSGSYATYSTPLTAPEGTHTLSYYSIDTANNNSEEGSEIFKTDLTNPTVDIYASPTNPNGSNGYYTSAPTITFTGLDNYGGSGLLNIYYHWDSNSDSTYTTGFNVPEGHHIIHYYAKDNAGNQTADVTRDYYVDTLTPTVSAVSAPVAPNGSNSYFTGTAPIVTLTGDDASGSDIANIKYRWGSTGDYETYTVPITAPENTNTLYYYAIDNAGNSGSSSPSSRTIKVDTANPSTTTPSATSPTNDTTPTWSWPASTDVESGIAGYYVKIGTASGGNNTLGETYLAGSNILAYSSSFPLSDNTYYLSVKAKDASGNIGAYTSSAALLVDATVPAITALTINNGDLTTGSGNITLQITVSDGSSGLSARQFSQDGVTYSDWEACDNTTCNDEKAYTLNAGDGTKTVYMKLKDLVGNESDASSDTILLDTTGPGAFSLSSPANDSWTNLTSMRLTWEGAIDLISGLAKYQLYLDDVIINDNIANSITLYDLSDLSIGTHTWQIKAIDNLNNATLSEKRTFSIDQTAPTAPSAVTVTNLSNTDLKLVKDLPVKISWTRSEDTGAGVLSYLVYIGTTSGGTDIINGEEVGTPSYDVNLQTDGTYFVTIKAKDGAGNLSVLSDEYSFKVDHTAPNTIAKTVSFDISNRIAGTYSAYIAWTASADPAGEGIKEYAVYQGDEKIATIPFNNDGKESPRRFVKTDLKPGNYVFKVVAVDLADNTGAFSAESIVEISAEKGPALTISDLKATPSTLVDPDSGKTSILVSWVTNSLSTSIVSMEGKTYGEEDLTKLNTGHSILITDLKDSTTYRFSATSRDIFGNQAISEGSSARTGAKVEKQSTFEIILNSLRDIFSVFTKVSAAALEKIGLIKPTQITKEGLIAFNVSNPEVSNAVVVSLVKAGQSIEKSTDGKNFSSLSTPTENYYIDDQVTAENTYYYRLNGSTGIARVNIGNKEDSAPTISDPKAIEEATQLADDKARIAVGWQTDIPSTSQISYGIGDTNLESTKDENLNTNHFVIIEGLKSGTEYKFKAKSAGENGLSSESSEFAFSTPKAVESQSIINIIIKQLQDIVSKFVSWIRI